MNAVAKSAGLAAFVLALAAWPAQAEKADRERPVNIESDTLRVDDANKAAVYEGNVVLTQGTLFMTADRLEVRQDDRGFTSSEAHGVGKPVYFRQKQESKDQYIEGTAGRIEYDAAHDIVKLIGSARVRRGDEEVRGNLIVYDAKTETYRAVGTTKENGAGRVRAVIKPKQGGTPAKGDAKP
ncbi:MAG: lipopolysaccharide transport periplasmic protein LptA [Betaproteobacteria bacterium]|nr:lipopolysaccharide transport periplasmic protein LptA [Betaproteobacteria bacterium]